MKKIDFKGKKKFILIGIAILLILAVIVGINLYQSNQRKQAIESFNTELSNVHESFAKTEERDSKLQQLKDLLKKYETYNKSDKPIKEISQKYKEEITSMRKYFTSEYDKTVSDNTIDKIEEIADKAQIITAKENLTKLLEMITSETDTVCTNEEAETYRSSINGLITSYDTRIIAIEEQEKKEAEEKAKREAEKKEAEEKAKREAEEKAAAEAAAAAAAAEAAQQQRQASSESGGSSGSSYSNSDGSSSGGGSGSNGSSNSSGGTSNNGYWEEWHVWDENGNDITPTDPDYNPNDPAFR